MAVDTPSKLTYADYAAFPDDGRRWEIIDGEAYVTPSPNTRHQELVGRLFLAFAIHLRTHGGGRVFVAPLDVVFSQTNVVQPDVVFIGDAESTRITAPNIQGPPTLAIEVLSEARHDLVRKRALYASFGVPEYWIVDPYADRVEVHRLAGATYPTPVLFEAGTQLTFDPLPGLSIDVAALFSE